MRTTCPLLFSLLLLFHCASPPPVDPTPAYVGTYACTFQNTSIDHRVNDRVLHNSGSFTNQVYQVADQTVEFRDPNALFQYAIWANVRSDGFLFRETTFTRWGSPEPGLGTDYNVKITGAGRLADAALHYTMRYLYYPLRKQPSDSIVTILSICSCQKK